MGKVVVMVRRTTKKFRRTIGWRAPSRRLTCNRQVGLLPCPAARSWLTAPPLELHTSQVGGQQDDSKGIHDDREATAEEGNARESNQAADLVAPGSESGQGTSSAHTMRWNLCQLLDPGQTVARVDDPDLLHLLPVVRRIDERQQQTRTTRMPTYQFLETGFTFRLSTTDPNRHPLPHPDLLTIHSAMMQVARAAGAVAYPDEFWEGDEEDVTPAVRIGSQDHPEDLGYPLRRFLEASDPEGNEVPRM